jgi:hypothetical protein
MKQDNFTWLALYWRLFKIPDLKRSRRITEISY